MSTTFQSTVHSVMSVNCEDFALGIFVRIQILLMCRKSPMSSCVSAMNLHSGTVVLVN